MQEDPAWKDNLLFFEYFHGDDGAGLGAMHQTGWTALVVDLILDPPGPATAAGASASHAQQDNEAHHVIDAVVTDRVRHADLAQAFGPYPPVAR